MANIDTPYSILENTATDGQKSRKAIVDCFNLINENGANATTFQSEYTADSFVSKFDLNFLMGSYLQKTGRVHNLVRSVDVDDKYIPRTYYYKNADNIPITPFDKTKQTTPAPKIEPTDVNPFSATFPTSYAVWLMLGYEDADDLSQYVNEHQDGG